MPSRIPSAISFIGGGTNAKKINPTDSPLRKRDAIIQNLAREQEQALARVEVVQVEPSSSKSELMLPGNIQAVTEAPILARSDGYIKRRLVDIGDRVQAGQILAEIEAPELDQQVRQAQANVQQMQASLTQALANRAQGKANADLARVTAERWATLAKKGAVSKQENDQYQAQYQAQAANLDALEQAAAVTRSISRPPRRTCRGWMRSRATALSRRLSTE